MKRYPLANRTEIHVYLAESVTPDIDRQGMEAFVEHVNETESANLEYQLIGVHPKDNYETSAKELIDFIRMYSCRRSLNCLFVALGEELLKDLGSLKDRPPLDEQSKNRKDKFKEQHALLAEFLNKFEQV